MPSTRTAAPTVTDVCLPVPGCVRRFRYDYARELRLWLLSLPGRVLLVVVFLMLDLRAYFAWARVGRDLARDTLAWSWANVCDWLRPPPCTHVRIERELRERYLTLILAPEWMANDVLERGLLLLGHLLDTPVPPAGLTLYPLTDRWLGSALAGDRRDVLVSETDLPETTVRTLASGDAVLTDQPRPALWLPLVHDERLVGCIEVRDARCIFRVRHDDVRNLLATLARLLAYVPLTGSDDDLPR